MTETLNRAPTGDSARGPGVDETPGPHPLTRRRPESSTSAHTTPASRLVQIPAVSEVRRHKGQLARGQGTAIEKRRHHRGSRRVSDQRRDLGDDRACNHFRYLTPKSVDEHFDGDRSGLPGSTAPRPEPG